MKYSKEFKEFSLHNLTQNKHFYLYFYYADHFVILLGAQGGAVKEYATLVIVQDI